MSVCVCVCVRLSPAGSRRGPPRSSHPGSRWFAGPARSRRVNLPCSPPRPPPCSRTPDRRTARSCLPRRTRQPNLAAARAASPPAVRHAVPPHNLPGMQYVCMYVCMKACMHTYLDRSMHVCMYVCRCPSRQPSRHPMRRPTAQPSRLPTMQVCTVRTYVCIYVCILNVCMYMRL